MRGAMLWAAAAVLSASEARITFAPADDSRCAPIVVTRRIASDLRFDRAMRLLTAEYQAMTWEDDAGPHLVVLPLGTIAPADRHRLRRVATVGLMSLAAAYRQSNDQDGSEQLMAAAFAVTLDTVTASGR